MAIRLVHRIETFFVPADTPLESGRDFQDVEVTDPKQIEDAITIYTRKIILLLRSGNNAAVVAVAARAYSAERTKLIRRTIYTPVNQPSAYSDMR